MTRFIAAIATLTLFSTLAYAQATDYVIDEQKDGEAFAAADWGWHSIGRDIEAGYANFGIFDSMQSIAVVRYKAARHRTDIFGCPGDRRSTTSATGTANKALAALNASYFNMKTLYPTTYFKDNGVQCGSTKPSELSRVNGVFCLKKGRKPCVVEVNDTSLYASVCRRYDDAIASGPILMDNGVRSAYDVASTFYNHRHPRTMIGVTSDGWVYMVVVDGRFPGQGDGATIAEMCFLAEHFGLYDALNLDGGGSSALWNHLDGVQSHPYDNKTFDHEGERKVPNTVLVF